MQNPADIVTKLKFLFIVVITLFGVMHIGAIIAFRQDADQRRRLLDKLQLPDAGFQVTKAGAWCGNGKALACFLACL